MTEIPRWRQLLEPLWRVFLVTFVGQLVATVQAVTNIADLAHYAWWKAAVFSAAMAAGAAVLRLAKSQPTDTAGVGVAGVGR